MKTSTLWKNHLLVNNYLLAKRSFKKFSISFLTLVPSLAFMACWDPQSQNIDEDELYAGGETTVFDRTDKAFSLPARNLSTSEKDPFFVGNSLFNKNWVTAPATATARDGLGPFFNTASCSACHFRDGRGRPPLEGEDFVGLLFRLSIPGQNPHGGPLGDPIYGGQLSPKALLGIDPEGSVNLTYTEINGEYADGTPYSLLKPQYELKGNYGEFAKGLMVSPRVAQGVYGLGLLEVIPEAEIRAAADPDDLDGDGISGRANEVWDVETQSHRLGRFGWKANQPSLKQQAAGAFNGDIGITSKLFPNENHTAELSFLDTLPNGINEGVEGEFELSDQALADVVFYLRTLAVPARRDPSNDTVLKGKNLFKQIHCAACHVPSYTTGESEITALSHQKIYPYTDLLLHDMGEELADNRPDFKADGKEWRTPPLWGLGLQEIVNGHTRFLHDGRARNLEEAILWHGGEAEKSKQEFTELELAERQALLAFLESL